MADEAVVHVEKGIERHWKVADATAIAKGTFMVQTSTDRTAIAHSSAAATQYPLGFATSEKAASDGQVRMSLQTTGIVRVICGATVARGELAIPHSTANRFQSTALLSLTDISKVVGRFLDSATAGTPANMLLRLG